MDVEISPFKMTFPIRTGEPKFSLSIPNLYFSAGEVVFLLGHNGSGKSTLLKCLTGEAAVLGPWRWKLLRPNDSVSYLDFSSAIRTLLVGVVRQQAEASLALDMTVVENLALRLGMRGKTIMSRAGELVFPLLARRKSLIEILRGHPELKTKMDQPVGNLSVGQRQTLAFLCVTSRGYPILLLDEFLASADHSTSMKLMGLAKKYSQSTPASVVVVSHDISFAMSQADRILVMRKGKIVQDISPSHPGWKEDSLKRLVSVAWHESEK